MPPGDQVHIDRPPRREQRPESAATDPLTVYSHDFDEKAREESRKLLSCTTGPYTVRFATESTVTLDKEGIAIPVSLDRVTKVLRVPD